MIKFLTLISGLFDTGQLQLCRISCVRNKFSINKLANISPFLLAPLFFFISQILMDCNVLCVFDSDNTRIFWKDRIVISHIARAAKEIIYVYIIRMFYL